MNHPKPVSALDPEPPGEGKRLDDESRPDGWMRADHYHCHICQGKLVFLGRIYWTASIGVRAVGCCRHCAMFMIEFESAVPKWIDIDKP